jgi:hypothetical protein
VPPGGQEVIKATFAFVDRTGLHEKYLVVHTDDLKESTIVLTMSVQIPEPVKLVPALISWGAGELSSSRTVTLELLREVSPAEIRATSSHPASRVLVLVTPGTSRAKSYQLVITPVPRFECV